jgi:hypothetical protein
VTELTLFADYHQIHVFDEGSQADLGDVWTDEAVADHVAADEDAVGLGTTVNVNVRVTVDILDTPPPDDRAGMDHVVEASLRSASGRLVVMGCTDYEPDARRFAVPPGWLRLRASRWNLERAYRADVASDDDPATMERVRVQIWPARPGEPAVLKRWQPPTG